MIYWCPYVCQVTAGILKQAKTKSVLLCNSEGKTDIKKYSNYTMVELWASPVAQTVKNLPLMQESRV